MPMGIIMLLSCFTEHMARVLLGPCGPRNDVQCTVLPTLRSPFVGPVFHDYRGLFW